MLNHHRRGIVRVPSRIAGGLALAAAITLTGCSIWDLGPQPDNYVGAGHAGPRSLTDPTLEAVTPQAHGNPDVQALVPGATMPFVVPGPAAPSPTTGPATQPAASTVPASAPTTGAASQPAVAVPMPNALTVQEAILIGLQNNVNLRVQRYNVPIQRTNEEQALSKFDPTISGSLQGGRTQTRSTPSTTLPFVTPGNSGITDSIDASATVTEFLPTGTTIKAGVTTTNSFYNQAFSSLAPELTVTQSLLRGAGLDVNLATLREAEVSTKISQYDLRGIAEQLVANIEQTYWNLAFAERQLAIVQNALQVSQEQLDSTNASIRVGRIAETERAAQQAQVESEKEDLINAHSIVETTRLQLMQLLTPSSQPFWDRSITLTTYPFIPIGTMDPVEAHVEVALRLSPPINEAKLQIQRGDLEIVRTKNGLLPRSIFSSPWAKTPSAPPSALPSAVWMVPTIRRLPASPAIGNRSIARPAPAIIRRNSRGISFRRPWTTRPRRFSSACARSTLKSSARASRSMPPVPPANPTKPASKSSRANSPRGAALRCWWPRPNRLCWWRN